MTSKYVPPSERPKIPRAPETVIPEPPNPWKQFVDRYDPNPELFVREVLGVGMDRFHPVTKKQIGGIWPNQKELLEAYRRGDRRISKRSGHRVGKTTVLAWILVHQAVFKFPQKSVCTAATSKQLFEALYAETVTWFKKLKPQIQQLFEIKSESIELKRAPEESFISFRTSSAEKPEALAGVHSPGWVLIICDEASGIPDVIFESAAGSMAGHNAMTILCGNPVRRSGFFFETFNKMRHLWTTFVVSGADHPNVSPDFVEQIRATYGELSNQFRVRVLGEFPKVDDDTIIPFELIEAAFTREVKPKITGSVWGLDVADKGRDANALAKRRGNALEEPIKEWRVPEPMDTVGRVKSEWDNTPISRRPQYIFCDAIGLGSPIASRLRELGLPAISINVSESAALSDRYVNLRTELWFKGRDWLAKKDCTLHGVLEDGTKWVEEELGHELALPTFDYTSAGKMKAEEKKLMKKRTGEDSPNRADAFLLTLVQDAAVAQGLTAETTAAWNRPLERPIGGLV